MSSGRRKRSRSAVEGDQYTVAIKCHRCGHTGQSIWNDVYGSRQLVSLEGFTERLVHKPLRIQLICNNCGGKVQPALILP